MGHEAGGLSKPPSEKFMEHTRSPRNLGLINYPDGTAVGVGSCGDSVEVSLLVENDKITDIKCIPRGCLYTQVCVSAMSVLAKGRFIEQALELSPAQVEAELDGLPKDHLHCARLAVNTLGEAIADYYRRSRKNVDGKV